MFTWATPDLDANALKGARTVNKRDAIFERVRWSRKYKKVRQVRDGSTITTMHRPISKDLSTGENWEKIPLSNVKHMTIG